MDNFYINFRRVVQHTVVLVLSSMFKVYHSVIEKNLILYKKHFRYEEVEIKMNFVACNRLSGHFSCTPAKGILSLEACGSNQAAVTTLT